MATAIVTGAARGLGAAIARRLHADGRRVLLADLDEDGAGRVAAELGPGAGAHRHDVRELASWERLLAAAGDDLDALVNNAARTEIRPFFEIPLEEWDDVLATNLRGTYLGIRVVGAALRDRARGGRIVNLSSVPVGRLGRPEEVAALVAWLLSDEAGFATGATFDLNGGMLMR